MTEAHGVDFVNKLEFLLRKYHLISPSKWIVIWLKIIKKWNFYRVSSYHWFQRELLKVSLIPKLDCLFILYTYHNYIPLYSMKLIIFKLNWADVKYKFSICSEPQPNCKSCQYWAAYMPAFYWTWYNGACYLRKKGKTAKHTYLQVLEKQEDLRKCSILIAVTRLWRVAQWASCAPPHARFSKI